MHGVTCYLNLAAKPGSTRKRLGEGSQGSCPWMIWKRLDYVGLSSMQVGSLNDLNQGLNTGRIGNWYVLPIFIGLTKDQHQNI